MGQHAHVAATLAVGVQADVGQPLVVAGHHGQIGQPVEHFAAVGPLVAMGP